jgi:hypothetical protein
MDQMPHSDDTGLDSDSPNADKSGLMDAVDRLSLVCELFFNDY